MSQENKEKKELSLEEKVKLQKQTHGEVYVLEAEGKYCILKKPDRNTYETALGLIAPVMGGSPKFVTAGQRILQACWLDGDKEILTNDELLVSFAMPAVSLIEVKAASLKKS